MKTRSSLLVISLQILLVLAVSSLAVAGSQNHAMDWLFPQQQQHQHQQQHRNLLHGFGKTDDSTKASDDDAAATKKPPGVVSDDIVNNGDDLWDKSVFDDTSNATSILPPEKEQPASWPVTVLVLFLVLAAGLIVAKAVQNCKKRREYENVPTTSLIV